MIIEPVFEGELEIGRFYMVPTVRGPLWERVGDWPVLGSMHEDRDIIGFDWPHYHYDFRFFDARAWSYVMRWCEYEAPNGAVMSYRPDIPYCLVPGPVVYRRRRCQRLMPEFPRDKALKGWLPRLEAAYADATLKPGLICPHRGASLRGLPVDERGCVVCPLHGLKWDLSTGRLVPEGS